MKYIARGVIGFIFIALVALSARGILHERPKAPKVQIIKSEPCPDGGVVYGKDYWPAGA